MYSPPSPSGRRALAALIAIAGSIAAAGCGGEDPAGAAVDEPTTETTAPEPSSEPATTTAPDTETEPEPESTSTSTPPVTGSTEPSAPATVPPGTTLRIGDQGGLLEIPLRLAGELEDVPYDVEFATFASGPLVNEAFSAGAIDIGVMGDTPALLSYAQGLDTVVTGVRASDSVAMTLVARPGSGITDLADIAGKKVAWTTGTNQHGFVLRALDSVGLAQDDVEQVDVPLTDVANVLSAGQADAAVLYELFRPPYIDANPDAVELVTLQDFTPSYLYLLAARDAVEDPAKVAALSDFLGRLVRSSVWIDEHPDEWIQAFYVDGQKQTPEYGRQAHEAQGFTEWIEPAAAQADQQEQADLFHAAGLFPEPVDLGPQFDPAITNQFTNAIKEAQP